MPRVEKALPAQPAVGAARPVETPSELVELGEIVLDRPAIGVVDEKTQEPPHVTPFAS
jgi:hypothetical protein